MLVLMRWDPWRELARLTAEMTDSVATPRALAMDAYRVGDEFHVLFDMPGIDPSTIDLTVEDQVLVVKAERREPAEQIDELVVRERPVGTFTRQVVLGRKLDTERLEASYEHGVLHVRVPVAEEARRRRIAIATPDEQAAIETTATTVSDEPTAA